VIEPTGISAFLRVAETFTFGDEYDVSLADVANPEAVETVVDTGMFWAAMPREKRPLGEGFDQTHITRSPNDSFLSENEILKGKAYQERLSKPFPAWEQSA